MKIRILGTRGEIDDTCPLHAKHSGVLIDDILLLDLGEKEYLNYDPKWIFLTHLHPDHAYFVRWGNVEIPPTKTPIYAPELPQDKKLHSSVTVLNDPIKVGSYTITPIPTHHSKNVKSQAYLIKKGKKSFLYTGDMIWIDQEYHPLFKNVDLIITEASFIRKGGMVRKDPTTQRLYGHNGIPNLIELFKESTKTIIFVHFGSWFYKDPKDSQIKLENLGIEKHIETIAGFDGMNISI